MIGLVRALGSVPVASHVDRMTDAAEPAVAGGGLRLQHARDAVAEAQIGMADDAGAEPRRPIRAARAHRRRAVDEFDLADRPHLDRAIGAVHRAAFDEDGPADVVAALRVGQQFVEQEPVVVVIPQMMVRIDDLQFGVVSASPAASKRKERFHARTHVTG